MFAISGRLKPTDKESPLIGALLQGTFAEVFDVVTDGIGVRVIKFEERFDDRGVKLGAHAVTKLAEGDLVI